MNDLETMVAIEAIRCLKARYFRMVDTKNWPALAALFHPEAMFDRSQAHRISPDWPGSSAAGPADQLVCGRDAIVAMIREVVEPLHTVHQGFMPEIIVQDGLSAEATWAMADELRCRDGTLLLAGRGHYHDRYAMLNGDWVIVHSRLTRLWLHKPDR